MALHGATFVAPLPGTPPVGMSATDGRLVMGGLYGTTPQLVAGGGIAQSGSNMQFTIAQSVFQLPDVTNAAATAFLPTDSTVLTPAVGPGTGSRIDLICIPFKNYENGDASSQSQPILVAGTPGTPGVAPPVPAGSYKYAQVTVGTGVTTASACTVQTFGNTTFAPPDLLGTTLARLQTTSGVLGQLAVVTSDGVNNGVYECAGGTTWAPVLNDTGWIAPTLLASWVNYGAPYRTAAYRRLNGVTYVTGLVKNGTATVGTVVMVLPAGLRPSGTIVLPVETSNTACLISVDASGNVALVTAAAGGGSLSLQFSFVAEA